MAIVGILEWQSGIQAGAAGDAAAVRDLISALGGLRSAGAGAGGGGAGAPRGGGGGGAGTGDLARIQSQIAAQEARNAAARVGAARTASDQIQAIDARLAAQRAALAQRTATALAQAETKGDEARKAIEKAAATELVGIEEAAARDRTRVAEREISKAADLERQRQAAISKEAQKGDKDREKGEKDTAKRQEDAGRSLVGMVYGWSKAIATETAGLLEAGEQLAIAETGFRNRALAQLTATAGSEEMAKSTYDKFLNLTLDSGLNRQRTLRQLNTMLRAGYGEEGAMAALKAVATETNVVSEQAGMRLAMALTRIQASGKTTAADVKMLARIGLDTKAVYEELGKSLGKSTAEVEFLLKKGKVAADVGEKAIEAVVQKGMGGAEERLAKGVGRQLDQIKSRFGLLFDEIDMSPLQDTLSNVVDLFKGPEGAALKTEIKGLFDTLNQVVFSQFTGPEGRARLAQFFTTGAAAAHVLADGLRAIEPILVKIISLVDRFLKAGSSEGGFTTALGTWIKGGFGGALPAAEKPTGAVDIGKGISAGVAQGIREGQPDVLAAIQGVIGGAVVGGKTAAKVASPSKLFDDEIGYWIPAGVAQGITRGTGLVTSAAKAMIKAGHNGAIVAGGAGAGSSEGLGGEQVVIHIDKLYLKSDTRSALYRDIRMIAGAGAMS